MMDNGATDQYWNALTRIGVRKPQLWPGEGQTLCCGRPSYCGMGDAGWPSSGTLRHCKDCPQRYGGILGFQGSFDKFYPVVQSGQTELRAFEVALSEGDRLFAFVHGSNVKMLQELIEKGAIKEEHDEELYWFNAHVYLKSRSGSDYPSNQINVLSFNPLKNHENKNR